jgi:myo-inositol catabolism protein IolC
MRKTSQDLLGQPAFVLAIDHRNSLRHWYLALIAGAGNASWTGAGEANADAAEAVARRAGATDALTAAKVIVADGLLTAITGPRAFPGQTFPGQAMLLVDEEYGQEAIRRLRDAGPDVQVIIPAERSGEPEFIFEHGAEFGEYIRKTDPDIVKALVRYNPAGDPAANARSRAGLHELTRWLDDHGLPLMLELLVPPTAEQAAADFDAQERPGLTVRAIMELSESGLAPAFWKVEGQPSTAAFSELAVAADGGRCLVLGRGEDAGAVDQWVSMAAAAEGFSGFAVGRTIWARALGDWLTGQLSRDEAVAVIAANYLHFVQTYLANRAV